MAWPIEKIKNTYFEDESLVIDLLYDLGSPTYKRASNALIFMTVCHGGDSMKLYYYLDSGMFHCYTHCCENFDIITLVQKALDCSFPEALKFLAERVGIEEDGRAGLGNKTGFPTIKKKEYKPLKVSDHVRPEITYYDDSLLDYLQCKKVVIDE